MLPLISSSGGQNGHFKPVLCSLPPCPLSNSSQSFIAWYFLIWLHFIAHTPARKLRSVNQLLLNVPKTWLKTRYDWVFAFILSVAAVSLVHDSNSVMRRRLSLLCFSSSLTSALVHGLLGCFINRDIHLGPKVFGQSTSLIFLPLHCNGLEIKQCDWTADFLML